MFKVQWLGVLALLLFLVQPNFADDRDQRVRRMEAGVITIVARVITMAVVTIIVEAVGVPASG